MNSIHLPERCDTADSSKSDDPLDGKPSEDAKLTHVDSCSSLPEAGDDLVSCSRRNSNTQPQPNYQAAGKKDELGNETLIQLLANASTLLTSQDLALPPNDPRSLLPTPFAPGQSAQTLLEQEQLRKKREQENEEWHAVCDLSASVQRPSSVAAAQAHAQMLLQNSPLVMQQQLQFGRGQHQPFIQQQLQAQPLLQQQHLLDLQQQGLMNPQQVNPLHLQQSLYATNPSPLAYQQPTLNEMPISSHLGVDLNPLGATGTSKNSVVNNLMPGLIPPNMPMTHNFASTRLALDTDTLDSADGMNWLLQRQPYEQGPITSKKQKSHMKVKGPKEEPAKVARKRSGKGNSSGRRTSRWAERYKELLEFKRVEGHCRVPHGYPPNKKLSWWIMNQRAQFARRQQGKNSWLTEERIKLLDDIGFTWSPNSRGH